MSKKEVNENIDADLWSIPKFSKEDNPFGVIEKSVFDIKYPKYREAYFKEKWNEIKGELKNHGVDCKVDYLKGEVEVSTTKEMWDPYIIIKARDMMKLICRSMSLENAKKVLDDNIFCEVIKLNSNKLNKEKFKKRRARLIGPESKTLKCIEILCECDVHIQGDTAVVVGSVGAIKKVTKIIKECMANIHPIYNIKGLMVRKELECNENMKNEDWDKYIPKYKPKKIKNKTKKIEKKKYQPEFPPAQLPSKVDLELESGTYFANEQERRLKKLKTRSEKQKVVSEEKKKKAEKVFEPSEEEEYNEFQINDDLSFSVDEIKKNVYKIKK